MITQTCFAQGSIFFQAYASSDLFGKLIFLGLFALSSICWYVLLQKFFFVKKTKAKALAIEKRLLKQKEQLLTLSEQELSKKPSNPFLVLYNQLRTKTVEILEKNHYFQENAQKETQVFLSPSDIDLIDSHLLSLVDKETKELEQNLFILSTIVSLAPFLGILGTVWGILISITEMQKGTQVFSNSIILGGLSTALATTVLGLVIAIPALIGYNYLKNSIHHFSSQMHNFSQELLGSIEMQYRKVDTQK